MTRGKAFIVVGHKNWGKSRTLRALTGDDPYKRKIRIKRKILHVRRMSNDDRPQSFFDMVDHADPFEKPLLIMTLCPTVMNRKRRFVLMQALRTLHKKYELLFFVLRTDYYKKTRRILDDEIAVLARFGKVKMFSNTKATPKVRATALKKLIVRSI